MWYLEWQKAKFCIGKPLGERYFCDLLLVPVIKLLQTFSWVVNYRWGDREGRRQGVSLYFTNEFLWNVGISNIWPFCCLCQILPDPGSWTQAGSSPGSRLTNLVKSWICVLGWSGRWIVGAWIKHLSSPCLYYFHLLLSISLPCVTQQYSSQWLKCDVPAE